MSAHSVRQAQQDKLITQATRKPCSPMITPPINMQKPQQTRYRSSSLRRGKQLSRASVGFPSPLSMTDIINATSITVTAMVKTSVP